MYKKAVWIRLVKERVVKLDSLNWGFQLNSTLDRTGVPSVLFLIHFEIGFIDGMVQAEKLSQQNLLQ